MPPDAVNETPGRLIIGISGASGVLLGIRALQMLQESDIESHLVISKATALTVASETDLQLDDIKALADCVYQVSDIAAAISSGSYKTIGMLIAPCSIKTLGEISSGVTSSLLTRAADVVLKERRRLVLMLRETPLHAGHLRNALAVTEMGAIIAPPVPAFYTRPQTIDDVVNQSVARVLDLFDIECAAVQRWGEDLGLAKKNPRHK
ncbi:3-octaprenyl-4-hydroxybenzoate carboxy-lyase [Chromatiales bacterium (ex Bugula neritina AB1)]|nr:3-octaprenyl-4-hydroxybenzoate carboxy-lyase [Chromatiales bacterium (ex Bugula neritina AB1)]